MEIDQKAQDYLDRLKIELSKVSTIMMEAARDGMIVSFSINQMPPFAADVKIAKEWK